jgi:hypothetical protein
MPTVFGLKCPERRDPHGLLIQSFTAQPEAPAIAKAGAFGWAANRSAQKSHPG